LVVCNHPYCSSLRVKWLHKAHHYLCAKSRPYHSWHHYKHHKKVHFSVLILVIALVGGLIYNSIPKAAKAGESFRANFDNGTLNADYALGSVTASNDGTPATLSAPGYNNSAGAVTLTPGKTLKYEVASNLDKTKGEIEMKFQVPTDVTEEWGKTRLQSPFGIYYDLSSAYIYIADSGNHLIVKTKIDGTGWTTYGGYGSGAAS